MQFFPIFVYQIDGVAAIEIRRVHFLNIAPPLRDCDLEGRGAAFYGKSAMKYTISINQRAVVEGGHPLDPYDCMILDFLITWSVSGTAQRRIVEGELFLWVSREMILNQVPMLRQWSKKKGAFVPWSQDTLYRRMQALENGKYIKIEMHKNKSWVCVLSITHDLYGTTPTRYDQLRMEKKSRLKGSDINPSIDEKVGYKSEEGRIQIRAGSDLNPRHLYNTSLIEDKNIDIRENDLSKDSNEEVKNENPSTVIPPQEIKEVPAMLPYCKPPAVMSGDRVAGTVSGWGQTIPWAEIKEQAPPAEPSFYWWFERYGKNAGQTKCEQIWSQHVHSWAEIAWHTVFFTYFRTTDKTMVPDPLKYLREFKYRDDIDDRRPKDKVKPAEEVVPNPSTPPTKLEIF